MTNKLWLSWAKVSFKAAATFKDDSACTLHVKIKDEKLAAKKSEGDAWNMIQQQQKSYTKTTVCINVHFSAVIPSAYHW